MSTNKQTNKKEGNKNNKSKRGLIAALSTLSIAGVVGTSVFCVLWLLKNNNSITHTITLDPGEGVIQGVGDSILVADQSTVGALPVPIWSGGNFKCWKIVDGRELNDPNEKIISDLSLVAVYISIEEKVLTFTAGETGAELVGPTTSMISNGSTFASVPRPTALKNNFVFFGWIHSNGTPVKDTDGYDDFNPNEELHPVFLGQTEISYELTEEQILGGALMSGPTKTFIRDDGKTKFSNIDRPELTYAGHYCNGWVFAKQYSDESGHGHAAGDFVTDNLNFADWNPAGETINPSFVSEVGNYHQLTFVSGSSGAILTGNTTSKIYENDGQTFVNIYKPIATLDGYEFRCWAHTDGSPIENNETYTDFTDNEELSPIFYVHKNITFALTSEQTSGGATLQGDSSTFIAENKKFSNVVKPLPEWGSRQFTGWVFANAYDDGQGHGHEAGDAVIDELVFADWNPAGETINPSFGEEPVVESKTINFEVLDSDESRGVSLSGPTTVEMLEDTQFSDLGRPSINFSNRVLSFNGWAKADGEIISDDASYDSFTDGDILHPVFTSDIQITFDKGTTGAVFSGPTTSYIEDGDTFKKVSRPTASWDNHEFSGWVFANAYHPATGGGHNAGDPVTDETTYANFNPSGETVYPVFDLVVTAVEIYENWGNVKPALVADKNISDHYLMGTEMGANLNAKVYGQSGVDQHVTWSIQSSGSYEKGRDFLWGFDLGLNIPLLISLNTVSNPENPIIVRAKSDANPNIYDDISIDIVPPIDLYVNTDFGYYNDDVIIEVEKPSGWKLPPMQHYYYSFKIDELVNRDSSKEKVTAKVWINNFGEYGDFTGAPTIEIPYSEFNSPIWIGPTIYQIPHHFLESATSFNSPITFLSPFQNIGNSFMVNCPALSTNNFALNGFSPNVIGNDFMANTGINTGFDGVNLGDDLLSIGNNFMKGSKYSGEIYLSNSLNHVGKSFMYECPNFKSLFTNVNFENVEWNDIGATSGNAPLSLSGTSSRIIDIYGNGAEIFKLNCPEDVSLNRQYFNGPSLTFPDSNVQVSVSEPQTYQATFEDFNISPDVAEADLLSVSINNISMPESLKAQLGNPIINVVSSPFSTFNINVPITYVSGALPIGSIIWFDITIKYNDGSLWHTIGKSTRFSISLISPE